MAETTLKAVKKGEMVTLHMFTGAIVGAFKVEKADAKTLSFTNKKGVLMTFDKKTGKQIDPEPKSDKFANFVTEYNKKEVEEAAKKRSAGLSKATEKKAEKAKAKKPVEKVEEIEDEEDDLEETEEDDEEEETVEISKPVKKTAKKAVRKVAKKAKTEEAEDDGFEELD